MHKNPHAHQWHRPNTPKKGYWDSKSMHKCAYTYICTCICMHAYIHTYRDTCIYIHICMFIHTHTYTHIRTHIQHVHVHACKHAWNDGAAATSWEARLDATKAPHFSSRSGSASSVNEIWLSRNDRSAQNNNNRQQLITPSRQCATQTTTTHLHWCEADPPRSWPAQAGHGVMESVLWNRIHIFSIFPRFPGVRAGFFYVVVERCASKRISDCLPPSPVVLYKKIFDLSSKSMFFTSFLLKTKLSGSRPAHAWCGQ